MLVPPNPPSDPGYSAPLIHNASIAANCFAYLAT